MVVTPQQMRAIMPFLFTVLRSVQYVKVDVPALEQACITAARKSAF